MKTYCTILLVFGFAFIAGASGTNAPTGLIVDGTPLTSWLTNYLIGKPEVADSALAKAGTNAIPTLLEMLRQKDERQNQAAYFAFLKLGGRAEVAVPDLIEIYKQRVSPFSQQCAAESLASIGPAANTAIPVLVLGAKDSNILLRCDTLLALGKLHSEPDLVVPTLTNALSDPIPKVRMFACMALGQVGKRSNQVVPALMRASTNDSDPNVRSMAAQTAHRLEVEEHWSRGQPVEATQPRPDVEDEP